MAITEVAVGFAVIVGIVVLVVEGTQCLQILHRRVLVAVVVVFYYLGYSGSCYFLVPEGF